MSNMRTVYVNRNSDLSRRISMVRELAHAGIKAERFEAVEGSNVPEWLVPYFDGDLSPSQTGCAASHLSIAATVEAPTLVLEDDARLGPNFSQIASEALIAAPKNWDIIRLFGAPRRAVWPVKSIGYGRNLVRYSRIPLGTTAYIISPSGAKKLLKPRCITLPIDVEIRKSWLLDLNVFGVEPQIAKADADVRSTITDGSHVKGLDLNPARIAFNIKHLGAVGYMWCLAYNAVGRHFA